MLAELDIVGMCGDEDATYRMQEFVSQFVEEAVYHSCAFVFSAFEQWMFCKMGQSAVSLPFITRTASDAEGAVSYCPAAFPDGVLKPSGRLSDYHYRLFFLRTPVIAFMSEFRNPAPFEAVIWCFLK